MRKIFLIITILVNVVTYCQSNIGHWDSYSANSQTLTLNKSEAKSISYKVPIGTSKVYYKIQVLKQIGDDVSTEFLGYFKNSTDLRISIPAQIADLSIKSSSAKATYFVEQISGGSVKQCYNNNQIISGSHINYFDNTSCINTNEGIDYLVFKFKSENAFFPLKIVFEIIPFIDNELERGWTKNLKEYLYKNLVDKLVSSNSDNISYEKIKEVSSCLLSNITNDYSLNQFQSLADYEKDLYFNKLKSKCLN